MRLEYIGNQQQIAELSNGKRVLLFKSSLLTVETLTASLKRLLETGLLIILG